MDVVTLGLQVLLSLVMAVAGVGKLADLPGSRKAVKDFGIPERFAGVLGTVLPLAELVIAVALIPALTARWAALAALLLFGVFIAGIIYNIRQGRHPECHCFGQLHSSGAGWHTVARNTVFSLAAGTVAWSGGRSVMSSLSELTARDWALVVISLTTLATLVALSWLLMNIWHQNGRLLIRIEALEQAIQAQPASSGGLHLLPSRLASSFDLPTVSSGRLTLNDIKQSDKPTLLIFSDPNCGPCNQLLPEVGSWHRLHSDVFRVALISRGSIEANQAKAKEHGLPTVAVQQDREVAQAFGANGMPSAVLVHPDGTIREQVAAGAAAIRVLVDRVTGEEQAPVIPFIPIKPETKGDRWMVGSAYHPPIAPEIGHPAPSFVLSDLEGETWTLDEYRGHDTVVLFWNPSCGFCQRMLPDLKRWEKEAVPGRPQLLVVSTGTPETNKAMNLHSTVVLDSGFTVGRAFGATGTPSAVLVADGRIASGLLVGSPSVLRLLDGAATEPSRDVGD